MSNEIPHMRECLEQIKAVTFVLEKNERQHFASLKQLAVEICDINMKNTISDNDIELRHEWNHAYDKIKIILNVLDPLGVADMSMMNMMI